MDSDGSFVYSTINRVDFRAKAGDLTAFPNPSTGDFNISLSGSVVATTAELYDLRGRLVFSRYNIDSGTFDISLSQTAGIYLLLVRGNEGQIFTEQLVVE